MNRDERSQSSAVGSLTTDTVMSLPGENQSSKNSYPSGWGKNWERSPSTAFFSSYRIPPEPTAVHGARCDNPKFLEHLRCQTRLIALQDQSLYKPADTSCEQHHSGREGEVRHSYRGGKPASIRARNGRWHVLERRALPAVSSQDCNAVTHHSRSLKGHLEDCRGVL